MKKLFAAFIIFLICHSVNAQWYWGSYVADMPEPISNNAVVEGYANDTGYVFSFGGIDTTKIWSGISLKSFRYNTVSDIWDTIPPLPDTMGKIAAGASYVDSIIYIIGGYHVLSNGNEISSNKVHRYDPRTNSYLSDGAPIPVPIDDHVQAVWNDSLIYVITGWSNNTNVSNIQIYDPANDVWYVGDPVPSSNIYRAFGASGTIIGNDIYYHGGASTAFNFPAQSNLRNGVINPLNPTQITWSYAAPASFPYKSYRSACIPHYPTGEVNWLGGSAVTYNYNGIAYNGSGGVSTQPYNLYSYSPGNLDTAGYGGVPLPIDLRGIGNFSTQSGWVYIAGGMEQNQQVSKKTILLVYTLWPGIKENREIVFSLFPNPTSNLFNLSFNEKEDKTIRLIDIVGKEVLIVKNNLSSIQIDISTYPKGIYFITVKTDKSTFTQKIILQ